MKNNMSNEKAEILGLLCAEGTHYEYVSIENRFFPKRGKYYTAIQNKKRIEFSNLNEKLLKRFQLLMKIVYGYKTKITGSSDSRKIHITKNYIIADLLKYTDFGFNKWKVPRKIKNSSPKTKAAFIRGVYEGDGVRVQRRNKSHYLFFDMGNYGGLIGLKELLIELEIKANVHKNNRNMFRLMVYGTLNVLKFKKIINPRIKRIHVNAEVAEIKKINGNPARRLAADQKIAGSNPALSSLERW